MPVFQHTRYSACTALTRPAPGSPGWRRCRPRCWDLSGSCSPARYSVERGGRNLSAKNKHQAAVGAPTAPIPTNAGCPCQPPCFSGTHPGLRRRGCSQRWRRGWGRRGSNCCRCRSRGCCCRGRCGGHRCRLLLRPRAQRRAAQAGCCGAQADQLAAIGDELHGRGRPGHHRLWLWRRSLLAGGLAGASGAAHGCQPHGRHCGHAQGVPAGLQARKRTARPSNVDVDAWAGRRPPFRPFYICEQLWRCDGASKAAPPARRSAAAPRHLCRSPCTPAPCAR